MICYAVIDTNVLVSSLLAKSADVATVQIMEKVIVGKIVPPKKPFIVTPRELINILQESIHKKE